MFRSRWEIFIWIGYVLCFGGPQCHPLICSEVVPGGSGLSLPYAVLRGEVSPLGKTVSSAYAPEAVTGVIQRVVFTEHKRNLSRAGFWFDSERVLHQYTNEAPFCLTKLQVVKWKNALKFCRMPVMFPG